MVCNRPVPPSWVVAGITAFFSGLTRLNNNNKGGGHRFPPIGKGKNFLAPPPPPTGAEWGEGSPGLFFVFNDVSHLVTARIAQNAAVAKRARSPLKAALKPAHHLPFGNRFGYQIEQFVIIGKILVLNSGAVEKFSRLAVAVFFAPVGMFHHHLAWLV